MHRLHFKSEQTAQGMVEFALVLPILLLLILGIFAFGHMFFVYSSVVSASREAARWGAAVGEAPSAYPRYRDCASIRASAVRVGAFAGVNATEFDVADNNDTGINIAYDDGPGTAEFATCPEGGTGPEQVVVGDRILVTVRVFYTPIVPFLAIPSFPLEATTARTIIINLPVGEAPIAEDPCTVFTNIELFGDPEPSYVGQPMEYYLNVYVPDDPSNVPTGEARLVDSDGNSWGPFPLFDGFTTFPYTYTTAGVRELTAEYNSDSTCYLNSYVTPDDNITHEVLPAPTNITLTLNPSINIIQNQVLTVGVTVSAIAPGAGVPTGPVQVSIPGLPVCNPTLTESGGNGVATCTFIPTTVGSSQITALYDESASPDYEGSTVVQTITVLRAGTPTPTTPPFTPTPIYTPTPVYTPTKTPLPAYCPRAVNNIDFSVPSALQFNIANNNADANNTDVVSVTLNWPSAPEARWQQIRLGPDVSTCDTSGGDRNCLWQNNIGLLPSNQTVNSSTPTDWLGAAALISKGDTETMRLVFNGALPPGTFNLTIRFSDRNCVLEIAGTR